MADVGSKVRLSCECEGRPKPLVYWSLNGTLVVTGGERVLNQREDRGYGSAVSLVLQSVLSGDFGLYECIAGNSLGEASATILLHREDYENR